VPRLIVLSRNIARVPAAGRNWEGFGADPYLSGEAAFATVQGMQGAGVQAWYASISRTAQGLALTFDTAQNITSTSKKIHHEGTMAL
jgi:hypothetical protein